MDIDYGVIIGLIATGSGAVVLALSYVGAFMLGQARGRRDAERERVGDAATVGHADRLLVVEGAVDSVARAIARLTEAQRIILLEQARAAEAPQPRPGIASRRANDTPA
jgi:hypothetical protein